MPSRVGRRGLIELALEYKWVKEWYLSLSEEEKSKLDSDLRKDIELLIRVLEG